MTEFLLCVGLLCLAAAVAALVIPTSSREFKPLPPIPDYGTDEDEEDTALELADKAGLDPDAVRRWWRHWPK